MNFNLSFFTKSNLQYDNEEKSPLYQHLKFSFFTHNNPGLSLTFIIHFALGIHYINTHNLKGWVWETHFIVLKFYYLYHSRNLMGVGFFRSWMPWKCSPKEHVRGKEELKVQREEEVRKEKMKITLFLSRE